METSCIVEKFESRDPHKIWEATWEILRCNDLDKLSELKAYIPVFSEILAKVEMGGAIRSNAEDTKLSLKYIEQRCQGSCRCYLYSGQNMFNPEKEAELSFVEIVTSQVMKELYEHHFVVTCCECSKKFKVREVHGWHVPWYEWSNA